MRLLVLLPLFAAVTVGVMAVESKSDSVKTFEKQLKSKNPAEVCTAAWHLAEYHRAKADLKSAEKLLKAYVSTRDFERLPKDVAIAKLYCILEMAHVKALQDDIQNSITLLNWAEQRQDEFQRAVSFLKYCEILLDLNELERGKAYRKSADDLIVKHLNDPDGAAIGQGTQSVDRSATWRELKRRSDELAQRIEFENMKEKFGLTYALYVKLRYYQLQLKRSYNPETKQKAFAVADEIIKTAPKSQFAEAAKYIKGVMLSDQLSDQSEKKSIREVKKYLEGFVKENPDGLYRGEALMLLGKISLECEWDAKDTEKYYNQALVYFQKACEKQSAVSMYDPLSDTLKRQAEPVTPLVGVDFKGSVKLEKPDPLKLYNTENAPEWYAKEQASECARMLMWLAWHRKDRASAKKYMELFSKYDDYQREQTELEEPSTIRRYTAVIDDNDPVFTESELKGLSSKAKLQMAYLVDSYLSEHSEQGLVLIDKQLKNSNLTEQERGCLWVMYGQIAGNEVDSFPRYEKIHTYFQNAMKHLDPKSDMYAFALLYSALYLPNKDDSIAKRIQLYQEYMTRFPNGRNIDLAHAKLILEYTVAGGNAQSAAKYQNLPLARKMLAEYKKKYKDPSWSADVIEEEIEEKEKEAAIIKKCLENGMTDWQQIDGAVQKELYSESENEPENETEDK